MGGLVVAAFFVLQLVVTYLSLRTIRTDTHREQRAEQSVVAAIRLEKLVLDLQTGTRGYVITSQRRFLAPWTDARRRLPAQSAQLRSLAPGAWSMRLDRAWRSYLTDWSIPLVRLADASPAQARSADRDGERVDPRQPDPRHDRRIRRPAGPRRRSRPRPRHAGGECRSHPRDRRRGIPRARLPGRDRLPAARGGAAGAADRGRNRGGGARRARRRGARDRCGRGGRSRALLQRHVTLADAVAAHARPAEPRSRAPRERPAVGARLDRSTASSSPTWTGTCSSRTGPSSG